MNINYLRRILAAFLLLAVLCTGPAAHAQKFLENYKKPMPDIPLIPQAEFEGDTTLYQEMPFRDKTLAFQIRLPKTWEKQRDVGLSNATIGNKILGELVRFYGPPQGDLRSFLTVQAIKLDYQQTAEQWLVQYLLSNAYTLQGIKTYDDKRVDALFMYVEKDTNYIVRASARINGKRVVFVEYFMPNEFWDQERQLQAQAVDSFKLQNPTDEFVEQMDQYHFLDISQFSYPRSWELHSDKVKSVDRLKVDLINVASEEVVKRQKYKTLNGKIEINLASVYVVDNLANELKRFRSELEQSGLMVQNLIETRNNFQYAKGMQARPVEVYTAIDRDNTVINYELWLAVMQSGDYYYIMTLLTPARDEDYFTWSKNTETFRLITKTVTPQEGSLIGN